MSVLHNPSHPLVPCDSIFLTDTQLSFIIKGKHLIRLTYSFRPLARLYKSWNILVLPKQIKYHNYKTHPMISYQLHQALKTRILETYVNAFNQEIAQH